MSVCGIAYGVARVMHSFDFDDELKLPKSVLDDRGRHSPVRAYVGLVTALLVAPAMALPSTVQASSETASGWLSFSRAMEPTPEQMSEMQELFRRGDAYFSAASYQKSIEIFTQLLVLAREYEADAKARARILYNLGLAYERSFKTSEDERSLRLARETFERYLREAKHYPTEYTDVLHVEVRLAAVNQVLAQIEAEQSKEKPLDVVTTQPKVEPTTKRESGLTAEQVDQVGRPWRWTGVSFAAIGLAGFATGGIFGYLSAQSKSDFETERDKGNIYEANRIREKGENQNLGAYISLGVGAFFAVTGAVMMVTGYRARSRARAQRNAQLSFNANGFVLRW